MATQLPHPSLSLSAPPFQNDYMPLHAASKEGQRDCAELLLANKADPNLPNKVTRGEAWGVPPMVVGADVYLY